MRSWTDLNRLFLSKLRAAYMSQKRYSRGCCGRNAECLTLLQKGTRKEGPAEKGPQRRDWVLRVLCVSTSKAPPSLYSTNRALQLSGLEGFPLQLAPNGRGGEP